MQPRACSQTKVNNTGKTGVKHALGSQTGVRASTCVVLKRSSKSTQTHLSLDRVVWVRMLNLASDPDLLTRRGSVVKRIS